MLNGLTLLGLVLLALALLAQVRRIPAPPALSDSVPVRTRTVDGQTEVEIIGRRGLILCFHDAGWTPRVEITEVSGPRTLLHPDDRRRYRFLTPASTVRLGGIWEELRQREFVLSIELERRQDLRGEVRILRGEPK